LTATRFARPLSALSTDDELLATYHETGDLRARDELVKRLLPLARKLALRYSYTDESLEDLTQVACVGLIKAIERFDQERGRPFPSFATPTILGELKRYFRDKGWAVHVPRALQERTLAISRESERLLRRLGRSPTIAELAAAVGCTEEQALEAMEAACSYRAASLDAPGCYDGDESAALVNTIGSVDDGYELAGSRQAIAETWRSLSELERRVLALRFVDDLTQHEIALRIGYSQMHVSRLLRRSLARLAEQAGGA
jgi:RNA polymerase sigma-B factor